MLQNEEFIQEFVEEAITHIDSVENNLLQLEGERHNIEIINDIFRAVHSIKGTAGFFGLDNIVKLAHAMENLFGDIRSDKLELSPHMIDGLLESNDMLRSMVEDVNNSQTKDITTYIDMLDRFRYMDYEEDRLRKKLRHGHRIFVTKIRFNEELLQNNIEPQKLLNDISDIGEIIETMTDTGKIEGLSDALDADIDITILFTTVLEKPLVAQALNIPNINIKELDSDISMEDIPDILKRYSMDQERVLADKGPKVDSMRMTAPKPQKQSPISSLVEESIRVNLGLLNDLMDLASELVLGRNRLLRTMEGYERDIPGLDSILQNMDNITTEMQEKIMQTRMQPVGNVFNKFPRIIRDMARDLGKEIELTMEGIDVELDKSIIESLGDPLTHLVRNAADHGIEKPEVREQLHKERIGHIHLHAYHEGGHVTIDVIDDGAGIDVEAIKEKAVEKKIVSQADVDVMGDKEALLLLFAPGFSTAETVTDVSGRGVGMDVVKTNIENLGGSIDLFTTLGEGTTFRLTLPLTLAIISSLIVEVAGQRFALPQINLQEMVRIKPGDESRSIEYINNSQVLRLRGKLLPLVYLSDILGLSNTKGPKGRYTDSITRILVLRLGAKSYGLVVDSIQDGEEILVKPLPRYISECRAYSGVTIMGDGSIAMILDPQGIAKMARLKFIDEGHIESQVPDIPDERDNQVQNMLLFKASGPEMLAVDLSKVARVDEIDIQSLEQIGDREYINYRGSPLMVIRPENYLPIQDKSQSSKRSYLIIPKYSQKRIGILIEKIYDTIHQHITINREDIKAPGIYGSTLIDDRIVLVLCIDELIELA